MIVTDWCRRNSLLLQKFSCSWRLRTDVAFVRVTGGLVAMLAGAATVLGMVTSTANAYELGFPGYEQKPGFFLGIVTAAPAPAPGWYSTTRFIDYEAKLVGPSAPSVGGRSTNVEAEGVSQALLWSSGWKFFGGTYEAGVIQPVFAADVGAPLNQDRKGLHNTLFVNQLAWNLGEGFFLKTALLTWAPTGTQVGLSGLGSVGNPWWTFQPAVLFSYLKNGWNLTANISDEISTENTLTKYRTGDIFHVDITATKTIDKWTVGPVAYYAGQITNDKSSAFYNYRINVNRYDQVAVGGLVGYNFGPARVDFWALQEVYARAEGVTPQTGTVTRGFTGVVALSFPFNQQAPTAAPSVFYRK
ncbi:MAG: transporter [Xanthobacteraceae bacterium]|nr:transporter [Xanthobacteraceae bacterium]